MVFQFQCPDCHMLEADESEVGQRVVCPYCGKRLIVPAPSASAGPETSPQIQVDQKEPVRFQEMDVPQPREVSFEADPDLFHISCSQGFVMEVPREMLGQEALCPCCHERMVLRLQDTHEFQSKKEIYEHADEHRLGNFWLHTSIIVVVLILFGFVLLVLTSLDW